MMIRNANTVTVTVGAQAAPALLLARVDLERVTNRATYPAAGVVMASGVPAPWSGTLHYLTDTLTAALALADLYLTTETSPALVTGHDARLSTWGHYLSGDIRLTQDQTLNGVEAPWTVSVPVTWRPA